MKKKLLLTSILTIVMCFSLIVGSTFALFTSESKVNVAVTSGTVKVEATVEKFEYKSLNVTDWTTVANDKTSFDGIGGSAVLDGNILTLDKIVPGDAVKFDIKVVNESNVTVKYRTSIRNVSTDNALFSQLKVLVNNEDFTIAKISDWSVIVPEKTDVETISLVIELPENVDGTEYMGKSCDLLIAVEAIQGNADMSNDIPVTTTAELVAAVNTGKPITLETDIAVPANMEITSANAVINGNGKEIVRVDGYTGAIFTVKAGASLTLEDVVIDGGAIWQEPAQGASTMSARTLKTSSTQYGVKDKVNNGEKATGYLLVVESGSTVTLGEDVVLEGNDGYSAICNNGTLYINGAQIINNRADGGAAIWGAGYTEMNSGKINGNHSVSLGGAVRMTTGKKFVMNGGEMNYNTAETVGGVIYGYTKEQIVLNGGEMAYNSANAGGAIWTGTYASYTISGTFKMHHNSAVELGGAIRFGDHASLTMTGGHVYNNTVNGESSAFFLYNNSTLLTGGVIDDNFSYSAGLGLTIGGDAKITGVIAYSLSTNHNTAYLGEEFDGFKFTTNIDASNFAQFNFNPADGYVYTEGDEAKLVCMNEGYTTYWDAATETFRLKAE